MKVMMRKSWREKYTKIDFNSLTPEQILDGEIYFKTCLDPNTISTSPTKFERNIKCKITISNQNSDNPVVFDTIIKTWVDYFRLRDSLLFVGKLCGIRKGMRLSDTSVCKELEMFLVIADGRYKLDVIAEVLDKLDVASASGRVISGSHVSNCIRKAIFHRGPQYEKRGYRGHNFRSYNFIEQPMKT